ETLVALQRLEGELEQTRLLLRLADETLARIQGGLRDWQIRIQRLLTQIREQATGWISMSLFKLGGTPVTTLGLLRLALILFIAWWVSYALRRALRQLGERREGLNQSAIYTVGRLSHYFIVTLGFIVGLSSIGVDFTNFALVAGALSIGIGFGLQSIVNNFVSGLILLFERSLKVGDWIELASGVAGEVREINVRSTVINTNDNIDIVVPNSEFMNNNVTNWTLAEGFCRIHLPFRVAYGVDKDQVRQAVLEAAEKLPHTLTGVPGRNPGVWLVCFGDNGLEFELVVWITPRAVKRPGAVNAAYMWEIESALGKYGIEIPIPQRDLRWREGSPRARIVYEAAGANEAGAN
ncbi:MAG: mechanosensitive ion channel, partial [Candidatus Competibacteraceae bacterium]|nr:mechanosensitive ion channel [Candidatus Competibacteraceae bacterium]